MTVQGDDERLEALLSQDVHVLEPPSLIHKTLLLLGVHTVGDLLALDMHTASKRRGVGATKIEALRQLQSDIQRLSLPGADTELAALTTPWLLDELQAAQVDVERPWDEVLRLLDLRTHNILKHNDVLTIRELVLRLESGTLLDLPGFGHASLEHVREHLNNLVFLGEEGYLWGDLGRAPADLDESISYVLQSLESDDHLLIVARFLKHQTLEEVGDKMGISREGVRQRLERVLELIRRQWRAHFEELLLELLEVLRDRGGLISRSLCMALTGDADRDYVILALEIVEASSRWCTASHFLTSLQMNQIESLFQQLKSDISARAGLEIVRGAHVEQMATTRGWAAPIQEIIAFLENRYAVRLGEDDVFEHPWMDWGALTAALLAERGEHEPRSLDELVELLTARHGLLHPPSTRQLYLSMSQHDAILSVERGQYVHRGVLELSAEELELFQQDAIALLAQFEHPVSTTKLIELLAPTHPDTVERISPTLLRDILGKHARVRLFQSTDMVAHLDSFRGKRQTQSELLDELLLTIYDPLDCEAICALIPDHVSYHPQAIYSTLQQADFVLNLGQGRFLHREAVGLTPRAMSQVCHEALLILSTLESEPISASKLLERLPASPSVAYLRAHPHGAKVLLATLVEAASQSAGEQLACGAGGLMIWSAHHTARTRAPALYAIATWLCARGEELDAPYRASAAMIHAGLTSTCGWDGTSRALYHALQRGVESDLFEKSYDGQEARFALLA